MSGWIAISRDLFKHDFFAREPMSEREAWVWMIAKAAWEDTRHKVGNDFVNVPRGSFFCTLRELQSAWGWKSDKRVRTFLKRTQAERMTDVQTDAGKTRVTICNYEQFQQSGRTKDATGTQARTQNGRTKETSKQKTTEANASERAEVVAILAAIVGEEAADNFTAFRAEMKKPMTPRSARAISKQLNGHHDPEAVLNLSIANSWQGIFPEKVQPTLKMINGGTHERNHHTAGTSQGRQNRPDPALEQIARLAGIGTTPGYGGR